MENVVIFDSNADKNFPRIENMPAKFVEVNVRFLSFGEIDTMNEKYHAEIIIESKWTENEKLIEYDPKIHWNPMLYVENALGDVKEKVNYEIIKSDQDFVITEIRYLKGEL